MLVIIETFIAVTIVSIGVLLTILT